MSYPSGDAMDEDMSQSTPKGKRELSTSKRAAQNRAAQVNAEMIIESSFIH
jgi:hypothetical protein